MADYSLSTVLSASQTDEADLQRARFIVSAGQLASISRKMPRECRVPCESFNLLSQVGAALVRLAIPDLWVGLPLDNQTLAPRRSVLAKDS